VEVFRSGSSAGAEESVVKNRHIWRPFHLNAQILRIQSHSIPKWREPAPTLAFALISPNLKFAKQVSVSSQPYAPWFLQAHFIKCICRCSQLHGKGGSRQCRNSQLPDIWNAQLMSELRYTLIVTSFIGEFKVTLDCKHRPFRKDKSPIISFRVSLLSISICLGNRLSSGVA
jgi:hypothetical protein